ncbi:MAG: ribosomal protein L7/L12 [Bacteroidota bacterium]
MSLYFLLHLSYKNEVMKTEYKIIESHYTIELRIEVEKLINAGWTLVGGLSAQDGVFYQAMVRKAFTGEVKLVDAGPNKLAIVKLVKDFTGFDLIEAKDLVDGAHKGAPAIIAGRTVGNLTRPFTEEEEREFRSQLVEAGANIE